MFGISLGSESSRTSQNQSGYSRNTFSRGTWDTLGSLESADRKLAEFNLDSVITDANDRAAIDTAGAVSNIFRQYRESTLPEIFNAQSASGVFGSSGAQLLSNDAYARTVNQAAELQLGVASSYINQSLQGRDQLLQQFAQLLQANLSAAGSESNFNIGASTGTGTGRSQQANLGFGGGGGTDNLTGGGGR